MSLREALREVFRPLAETKLREEERVEHSTSQIKIHLRKLEEAATRHVTEATDDVAEFQHERRT